MWLDSVSWVCSFYFVVCYKRWVILVSLINVQPVLFRLCVGLSALVYHSFLYSCEALCLPWLETCGIVLVCWSLWFLRRFVIPTVSGSFPRLILVLKTICYLLVHLVSGAYCCMLSDRHNIVGCDMRFELLFLLFFLQTFDILVHHVASCGICLRIFILIVLVWLRLGPRSLLFLRRTFIRQWNRRHDAHLVHHNFALILDVHVNWFQSWARPVFNCDAWVFWLVVSSIFVWVVVFIVELGRALTVVVSMSHCL